MPCDRRRLIIDLERTARFCGFGLSKSYFLLNTVQHKCTLLAADHLVIRAWYPGARERGSSERMFDVRQGTPAIAMKLALECLER